MIVKITTEVDIDVSDLDPKFVDIKGFALDEAARIMENEPEFFEFDYEIKEEDNMNAADMIKMIDNKSMRDREESLKREQDIQVRKLKCEEYIHSVKPRIDELIKVANYALLNGIKLDNEGWGAVQNYETGYFFTNSWSHLLGFVKVKNEDIRELGIFAGGACGPIDFLTDGNLIYGKKGYDIVEPLLHDLEYFVRKFDEFETAFYEFIEKKCK